MRTSTSAIVARNETWSGNAATEPYEAGWAKEAIIFVRSLKTPQGPHCTARVEISPDGPIAPIVCTPSVSRMRIFWTLVSE